jgi:hypothetical protein
MFRQLQYHIILSIKICERTRWIFVWVQVELESKVNYSSKWEKVNKNQDSYTHKIHICPNEFQRSVPSTLGTGEEITAMTEVTGAFWIFFKTPQKKILFYDFSTMGWISYSIHSVVFQATTSWRNILGWHQHFRRIYCVHHLSVSKRSWERSGYIVRVWNKGAL